MTGAVITLIGVLVGIVAMGQVGIDIAPVLPQFTTPQLSTSTLALSPVSTTTSQSTNAIGSTTTPAGAASISAQTADGVPSTASISGLPSPTAQVSNSTVTNIKPSGTSVITPQVADGDVENSEPDGTSTIVPQSSAATLTNTQPTGSASVSSQIRSAFSTNTQPSGTAPISPQLDDATLTNIAPAGSASITGQASVATLTNSQPTGTSAITPQNSSASPTNTQPSGSASVSSQTSSAAKITSKPTGSVAINPQTSDSDSVTTQPVGSVSVISQTSSAVQTTSQPPGSATVTPQTENATLTTTQPDGSASTTVQGASASAVTSAPSGSAPVTAQTSSAALTNTQPIGSSPVAAQTDSASSTMVQPSGAASVTAQTSLASVTNTQPVGSTTTAPQNSSATSTSTEPVGTASIKAQTSSATSTNFQPIGSATITPQSTSTAATTTKPTGTVTISAQTSISTATSTKPIGSESISTQDATASVTSTKPTGLPANSLYFRAATSTTVQPPGATTSASGIWYVGAFTIDSDADGTADDPVYFVLSDTESAGVYDTVDLSTDDLIFGEGATSSQTTGVDDDERIISTKVVRLGDYYTFRVSYVTDPTGPAPDISLRSITWFTGSFSIDADGDDSADDTIMFAQSDTDSNGTYDTLGLSLGDSIFNQGGPLALTNLAVNPGDDEIVTSVEVVMMGPFHDFEVTFAPNPPVAIIDVSLEAKTWFVGSFTIDSDGDGIAENPVNYALSDTNSDGLFETFELSSDNLNFGQGSPGNQTLATGDDETLTSPQNLLVGDYYTFSASFESNPAIETDDASLESSTWFTGKTTIDSDANGAAGDIVHFALSDADSDGLYDTMDVSLDNSTFGVGSLFDSIIGTGEDERVTAAQSVRLGDFYTFGLSFTTKPSTVADDISIESETWFTGNFTIDSDADGSADNDVNYALVDTNSNGLFDTLELSTDNLTFGEGDLGIQTTGTGDDERITGTTAVRLGTFYTFNVEFDASPPTASEDASIESVTWFTGDFTIDIDANGSADDTVSYSLVDTDSNGLYDTMDISSDDTTFGEGGPANLITGANDDERITVTLVRLGEFYTFDFDFVPNPPASSTDATIESKTWYTGTFTIDSDADGTSNNTVYYALSDANSDGVFDSMGISTDDPTFGEGSPTNQTTGASNDETIIGSENVRLGSSYTFAVAFDNTPAVGSLSASIENITRFIGSLNIDTNADGAANNPIYYALTDTNSDGVYDIADVSSDDASFGDGDPSDQTTGIGNDEQVTGTLVRLGDHYTFDLDFANNPGVDANDFSVESSTWFVGVFTIDADADENAENTVNYALVDSDSDGLFETMDISTDDIEFGSGSPTDQITGSGDDETISGNENVRLGDYYTFAVGSALNPASTTVDASITAATWFTGTFTIDSDADGTATDTVYFVLTDTESDGLYDTIDVSSDDLTFGGGELETDTTGDNDDERVTGVSVVRLGDFYTFSLEFEASPPTASTDATIEATTWFTGNFTIDADSDGVSNNTIFYALTDIDSDGLYERLDISSDDATFGEGDLGDLVTGTNEDERVSGTVVRLGDYYKFDLDFVPNPAGTTSDLTVEAASWYVGTFTIDADADATSDDTVYYALSDANSDGVFDSMDISTDDAIFGEVSLSDLITGTGNDERITGTAVRLGNYHTFDLEFTTNPATVSVDAQLTSNTWFTGSFEIDIDADGAADDTVVYALSDTNSDGLYDTMEVSTDDGTFGSGADDLITGPTNLSLGAHYTFTTDFAPNPAGETSDATLSASTWFIGEFTIDVDADATSDDTISYALSDSDSNGLYETIDLSSDGPTFGVATLNNGTTGPGDDETSGTGADITLGDFYAFTVDFTPTPPTESVDSEITATTWYTGTLALDVNGNGVAGSEVNYSLTDTDSDGLYDALDLSTDDSTFGEEVLTNLITGANDDERVTGTTIRLGNYYSFDLHFAPNPAGTSTDLSAESVTWFTGSFTIDADANGVADNTILYTLVDTDSNGLYETMDLSIDDSTFGEGSFSDQITGSNDDETVASDEDVRIGQFHTFNIEFESNPSTSATDATLTSKTWFTGVASIDADADDLAHDSVHFALVDTDSNGVYETLDVSINDSPTFGQGSLDSSANSSGTDDARLTSDGPLELGIYDFIINYVTNPANTTPDFTLTSNNWFEGEFSIDADADGSDDNTVYFTLSDTVSNGLYDVMDVSLNDQNYGVGDLNDATVNTNDERIIGNTDLLLGAFYTFETEFASNPAGTGSDGILTSRTWFVGDFTIDADADGTVDDTVEYVLTDTNSDGLYEKADLSTDDAEFGESSLSNQRTGVSDDEKISSGEDVRFGSYYTFTTEFASSPANEPIDATITSTTWFTGELTVDINANGSAGGSVDRVNFALVDTDSDGIINQMELSVRDDDFGEGAGSDLKIVDGNDEIITGTDIEIGPYYTFTVEFDDSPGDGDDVVSFTSKTWFTGFFLVDIDANGSASDAGDIVNFALSDTDSNGVFEQMELSVADTTYGQGSQTNTDATSGDDESLNSTTEVTLGSNYEFSVQFDTSPRTGLDTADITSITHFDGTFSFDADANGIVTPPSETVNFSLVDNNSDGLYDTMDISLGNTSFSQGNGSDQEVTSSAIGGSNNDERISTPTTLILGTTYAVEATFDSNPGADNSDASIRLTTDGTTPVAFSNVTATGSWIIDADGNEVADDLVHFAILDTDSDGVMDAIDISIGDKVFGDGNPADLNNNGVADGLEDGIVDFGEIINSNDERISFGAPSSYIQLGIHTFLVEFDTAVFDDFDDARLTSAFYVGAFLSDSITDLFRYVQVDTNSDGLYTNFEIDANSNDSLSNSEIVFETDTRIEVGNRKAVVKFNLNPTVERSAQLRPPQDLLLIEGEDLENQIEDVDIPSDIAAPTSERVSSDTSGQPIVVDEIVLNLSFDLEDPARRISQIVAETGGEVIGAIPEIRAYQMRFQVPNLRTLDMLQSFLESLPGVDSASRHYLLDIEHGLPRIPNDTSYGSWVLDKPEGDNWNLEFINAPAAWDITTGSQAVRVAVVDADMDADHPDLIDSVYSTFGKRTTIADGHGTHVAGTLCAQGNNSRGVSGVAWDCDLRLYDFGGVSTVRALQTMVKAVNDGAHIVNMSLQWIDNGQCGKPGTPDTLQKVRETNAIFARAIEFAQKKGQDVLWVFASGNECRDVRYASPASLVERFPDNVIVVSSIEVTGKLSPFSNFGDLVSVAAPGSQILSTLPQACDAGVCTEQYGLKSGTSMAAPHVSGLAALVKAAHPSFSAAQIKQCILDAAVTPIQGRSFKTISAPKAVLCGDDLSSSSTSQPVGGGGIATTPGTPSGGQ